MFALCPPRGGGAVLYVCWVPPWPFHRYMHRRALVRTGSGPSLLVSSCPTASRLWRSSSQPSPVGKGLLSLAGEEGPPWFSSVVSVCEQLPGRRVVSSCWAEACEGGLGMEGVCP